MNSHKETAFKISTLTAALLAVYGVPALASDDEVLELITPRSSVTAGVGFQNNDRAQFGIYDGRRDNGGTLLLDADIKKRDDVTGTWTQLKFTNLGLSNRELEASYGRQGDYNISFEYSRIPRDSQYTVNTGLLGIGTTTQTVTSITPGSGANNLQLGTDRDRSTFGFIKKFSDSLELSVKYRNEEKKGQRHFGANAGGANNPNFFVEPINSRTHQLDASLNYLSKDLQLQGGYYGSWYKNANSFLTAINGATTLYVTLPPDNFAHQLFLNGSYAISPSTKATMRLAHTTGIQDDQRLRTDLPAGQVWAGWGGVKAKVVTSEAQLGISSKPMKDLSLLANVHYQDRADKTPVVAYNNQATPDDTTPHSFKSLNAKFEASYRVQPGFKLLGGAYLEIRERSIPYDGLNNAPAVPTNAGANWTVPTVATNEREVPYRSKTEERTLKAQATKSLSDELNGSLALAHSKRDGSSFKWTDQINLVNPLHMANRDRDKVGVKLDWSSSDLVSVQAQFDQAKDDYGRNGLNGDYTAPNGMTLYGTGIRDGSAQLFSFDANFKLSDSWQLTAWYSRDETKATQYSYQANFGTDPIRKANLADTGDSLGIGVKGKATARLLVGADLQWNKSVGKYQQSNFNNQANMVEGLPDITNKTLRLALNGTYQLDKNSSVRVDLIHDRWETNDWTWTMWNNAQTALIPYAYNTDGTSVSTKGTQSANVIAIRYKYEF